MPVRSVLVCETIYIVMFCETTALHCGVINMMLMCDVYLACIYCVLLQLGCFRTHTTYHIQRNVSQLTFISSYKRLFTAFSFGEN